MIIETIFLVLGIASVASTETTGRGITDHAISATKGKDCKIARTLQGEDVCQPKGTVTVSAPPKEPIPPITPENPPPKRIIVVSNSIDDMERIMALRKSQR